MACYARTVVRYPTFEALQLPLLDNSAAINMILMALSFRTAEYPSWLDPAR